jgi:hypothetical protein
MQTDGISSATATEARPARPEAEQRASSTGEAPADQRVTDAAARRASPVDQAQLSPQARALADAEAKAEAKTAAKEPAESANQSKVDERRAPERQAEAQRAGQQQNGARFETLA